MQSFSQYLRPIKKDLHINGVGAQELGSPQILVTLNYSQLTPVVLQRLMAALRWLLAQHPPLLERTCLFLLETFIPSSPRHRPIRRTCMSSPDLHPRH